MFEEHYSPCHSSKLVFHLFVHIYLLQERSGLSDWKCIHIYEVILEMEKLNILRQWRDVFVWEEQYGSEKREKKYRKVAALKTTDRKEFCKDAFMFHDNHM